MQSALIAAERLNDIFDLEIEKSEVEERKVSPKYLTGQITFKDVTFRYGMRNNVLNNISF